MATKKQQALQIFNDLVERGHNDRKMIIQRFIDALDMTPAGAATYYAACKKELQTELTTAVARASNPTGKSADAPAPTFKAARQTDKPDSRTLYSVCTPGDDDGSKVVDSTGSHFDKADALQSATADDVVVKGVPDIGAAWDSLKPIN